jgi:threonine/homoserine/homoserine lactone efflux protein
MDLIGTLPAFLVAVVLISASPGPAMALIFRRAALRGFGSTIPTVLGLELGIYMWALSAGAGLAALVAASQTAYLVLRIAGAAFLFFLGVRAWLVAWRDRVPDGEAPDDDRATRPRGWLAFGEGLIVQLANPKAAIFMFAFYPQFIPAGQPLLKTTALLALIQVTVESVLYLALAAGVDRAGSWFRRPRVRRRLEAVTGTVLIGLGLRVAVSHR